MGTPVTFPTQLPHITLLQVGINCIRFGEMIVNSLGASLMDSPMFYFLKWALRQTNITLTGLLTELDRIYAIIHQFYTNPSKNWHDCTKNNYTMEILSQCYNQRSRLSNRVKKLQEIQKLWIEINCENRSRKVTTTILHYLVTCKITNFSVKYSYQTHSLLQYHMLIFQQHADN